MQPSPGPSNYHVVSVSDTTFQPDNYGNKFYSIKFNEFSENVLWKTKNRPTSDMIVYGHIEKSASGKSWLFKRDQKPDQQGQHTPSGQQSTSPQNTDDIRDTLRMIQNQVNAIYDVVVAKDMKQKVDEVVLDDIPSEPINIDDIPF